MSRSTTSLLAQSCRTRERSSEGAAGRALPLIGFREIRKFCHGPGRCRLLRCVPSLIQDCGLGRKRLGEEPTRRRLLRTAQASRRAGISYCTNSHGIRGQVRQQSRSLPDERSWCLLAGVRFNMRSCLLPVAGREDRGARPFATQAAASPGLTLVCRHNAEHFPARARPSTRPRRRTSAEQRNPTLTREGGHTGRRHNSTNLPTCGTVRHAAHAIDRHRVP